MLVVGLTGGIGTGKSTVSGLLSSRHHLSIVDADILARDAIAPGSAGFRKVVAHFGADRILNADGSLNRSALGDIIFRDPNERQYLNGIIHPAVRRMMFMAVLKAWLRGEWCIVLDVPLLIEANLWKWVGEVMVVFISEKLQLRRILDRPPLPGNAPLTESQAQDRMRAQMPVADKLVYATTVVDNSGSLSDLEAQVDRAVAKWRAQQGGSSGWWWKLCWLVPPVGIMAGWICLLRTYFRAKTVRKRTRGEVERRGVEMQDLKRA
ncbi:hypothetical protein CcaverHIS002_0608980 [Cutaneotrichosporon cavernicola]|uniref:CoaE-domain-containing protein n=1 Tax=Cutaneotrichosporon cavernicola TaxID=279322 RepID=A0AA48L9H8_9TREE|nr:uncharacterized protein CcaverHIS019_0608440 [Cutaneotrichosporon cavernicola]BEI86611.1 hypothetical protein CcaverHIS002_0608980 [Cutaneotrichosporon cavernicola]BEI94385.1 hypothetical protein CcaverHIS019_0608440 [Cutaneotrichosporon cavernicola]BEJ02162.1 hypothetical protein CcaverHIS631_0608440 [Cutaneotrichosporon cavernicola]BEJ09923.1 hypothetical protein CcaverHIS641_0608380 [Cutaneotrichosporon cavernicola]